MHTIRQIIIKGDFFDCQLYKNNLYLWDMEGFLHVYDWNRIYYTFTEVIPSRIVRGGVKALERFRLGRPVDVPGGYFPTDTAFMGEYLYTATEQGVYRGYAHKITKEGRFSTSARPTKYFGDIVPVSLSVNSRNNQLSISAGDDGLFEVNLSQYNPTVGLQTIDQKRRIYKVSGKNAIRSRYVHSSLYSTNAQLDKTLHFFEIDRQGDLISRRYMRDFSYLDILREKTDYFSSDKRYSSISRITKKGVETYPLYHGRVRRIGKPLYSLKDSVSKPSSVEPSELGTFIETDNGLFILGRGSRMVICNRPISRWRLFRKEANTFFLFVILEETIEIHEITKL